METVAILERELYEVKINLLAGGIVKVVLIENRPIGISGARSRSGANLGPLSARKMISWSMVWAYVMEHNQRQNLNEHKQVYNCMLCGTSSGPSSVAVISLFCVPCKLSRPSYGMLVLNIFTPARKFRHIHTQRHLKHIQPF